MTFLRFQIATSLVVHDNSHMRVCLTFTFIFFLADSVVAQTEDLYNPLQDIEVHRSACRGTVETYPFAPEACQDALEIISNFQDPQLLAELQSSLAVGYARNQDLDQARALINRALKASPDYWLVHANHGTIELLAGQFSSAEEAMDRAIALAPQRIADLYLNRSLARRGSGRFEAAEGDQSTYLQLMGHMPLPSSDASSSPEPYGPPLPP
ncbi:MAG: tetratricopeptide repeat protein [Pseudomonadota bacterium]|nr:tetratricopeptide repeat protein [Pseudomonadota bacterium]